MSSIRTLFLAIYCTVSVPLFSQENLPADTPSKIELKMPDEVIWRKKGVSGSVSIITLAGTQDGPFGSSGLGIEMNIGYQFSPHVGLAGIVDLERFGQVSLSPIYGQLKFNFAKGKVSPFTFVAGGYVREAFPDRYYHLEQYVPYEGYSLYGGLGLDMKLSTEVGTRFFLGYKYYDMRSISVDWLSRIVTRANLHRVTAGFSLSL